MSGFNFRDTAINTTSLSKLMDGRKKASIDDIISAYPNGITVNGFDVVNNGDDTYSIGIFAEDNGSFFFGGSVFTKIVRAWVAAFDGDVDEASHQLGTTGGVKMQFSHGRTKNGNNITLVKIL